MFFHTFHHRFIIFFCKFGVQVAADVAAKDLPTKKNMSTQILYERKIKAGNVRKCGLVDVTKMHNSNW